MKEGWTYRQLKDVTNKISDGSHNPPKGIAYSEYPMLSSKNILFDDFNYDSPRYLSKEDFDIENKRTDISDGDVLLTIVGTVGRTCCVQNPFIPFTLQRSVAVLKPKKEILLSRFLMYALYSLSDLWDSEAKGAAQKGVYLKQLAAVYIPTPPIAEQERIVERLDAAFAQIDELKSNAEKQLAEARALFQSALTQAMQPKPGWQEKKLKEICTVINGRAYAKHEMLNEGKYRLLRVGNFFTNNQWFYSDLELEEDKYCDYGDLLYAWSASFGPRIWGGEKVIYHYHIWKMICSDEIYKLFLFYWLDSDMLKRQTMTNLHGTTMAHITKNIIENSIVVFPSMPIQKEIASNLDSISKRVKDLEEISRKVAAECDAMKQALLRQIFE